MIGNDTIFHVSEMLFLYEERENNLISVVKTFVKRCTTSLNSSRRTQLLRYIVFDLDNQHILNKMMYHKLICQI